MEADREKVAHYAEFYRSLGSYPYERDPLRPDWFQAPPNPDDARTPDLKFGCA